MPCLRLSRWLGSKAGGCEAVTACARVAGDAQTMQGQVCCGWGQGVWKQVAMNRLRQKQLGYEAPATRPVLAQPGASCCAGGTHPYQDGLHQCSMQTLHLRSHLVHSIGHVCTGSSGAWLEMCADTGGSWCLSACPGRVKVSVLRQRQAASNRPKGQPPCPWSPTAVGSVCRRHVPLGCMGVRPDTAAAGSISVTPAPL